ncbi:uncharacterized protein G2W53_014865 [Senna tora]|uniref:Uncharacterized protein n=1 Tax=Senna tora TaxID=362788 RepID=A0A835C8U9_9FABA|nr:uncharacterized protein G2W53_014865 [Senna tora]
MDPMPSKPEPWLAAAEPWFCSSHGSASVAAEPEPWLHQPLFCFYCSHGSASAADHGSAWFEGWGEVQWEWIKNHIRNRLKRPSFTITALPPFAFNLSMLMLACITFVK